MSRGRWTCWDVSRITDYSCEQCHCYVSHLNITHKWQMIDNSQAQKSLVHGTHPWSHWKATPSSLVPRRVAIRPPVPRLLSNTLTLHLNALDKRWAQEAPEMPGGRQTDRTKVDIYRHYTVIDTYSSNDIIIFSDILPSLLCLPEPTTAILFDIGWLESCYTM